MSKVVPTLALFAGAALFAPPAGADIAVQFPAGTSPEDAAVVLSAVRDAQGAEAKAFFARELAAAHGEPPQTAIAAYDLARRAYDALELDTASTRLSEAEGACLAAGSCAACADLLFDVHLLAGAIAFARKDEAAAAEEFLTAHEARPSRVVDPRRFPPKIASAFNRACAEGVSRRPMAARVLTEPSGAHLRVDGGPRVETKEITSKSRHVHVEADLAGYAPRCEAVALSAKSGAIHTIRLAPLAGEALDVDVARRLAERDPVFDPALFQALARLGIDRVLVLSPGPTPRGFSAKATHAAAAEWYALPALASAQEARTEAFTRALVAAVGAQNTEPEAVAEAPQPPATQKPQSAAVEFDDEEEDDELVETRLPAADPADGKEDRNKGRAARVFKSPWLWISVGVVVAVVGGVVLGTQLNRD